MRPFSYLILIVLFLTNCTDKKDPVTPIFSVKPETPSVILADHKYFLNKLEQVTSFTDSTGMAAKKLYEVMEYHFKAEEEYVLPPLGILPGLAKGQFPKDAEKIILLTDKFRKNENIMLAEHQMISHYAKILMRAAKKEGHQELLGFDVELEKHAALEEEILFPMVLVMGEYLRKQ